MLQIAHIWPIHEAHVPKQLATSSKQKLILDQIFFKLKFIFKIKTLFKNQHFSNTLKYFFKLKTFCKYKVLFQFPSLECSTTQVVLTQSEMISSMNTPSAIQDIVHLINGWSSKQTTLKTVIYNKLILVYTSCVIRCSNLIFFQTQNFFSNWKIFKT